MSLEDLDRITIPHLLKDRRLVNPVPIASSSITQPPLDSTNVWDVDPPIHTNLVRFNEWTTCYYLIAEYAAVELACFWGNVGPERTIEELGFKTMRSIELNQAAYLQSLLKLGGISCPRKNMKKYPIFVRSSQAGKGLVYHLRPSHKPKVDAPPKVILLWDVVLNADD